MPDISIAEQLHASALAHGVAAATSGNSGAAVASQAAKAGLGCIVVEETEYTGAGKHPLAQLNLARCMGVEVTRGDPRDNRPGQRIVIPAHPSQLADVDVDRDHVRRSYLRHAIDSLPEDADLGDVDLDSLAAETRSSQHYVQENLEALRGTIG